MHILCTKDFSDSESVHQICLYYIGPASHMIITIIYYMYQEIGGLCWILYLFHNNFISGLDLLLTVFTTKMQMFCSISTHMFIH